jgi:hypothetical protein
VSRFLKLSLPAVLAVGIACSAAFARPLEDATTLWNAWYGGDLIQSELPNGQISQSAVGWGHGAFFNSSTALYWDTLDTTTTPNKISEGVFMIYGPNLDMISGLYEGERSEPDANGICQTSGTYVINSGMGPWLDVSGFGTYTGTYNVQTGESTMFLEGMISAPEPF